MRPTELGKQRSETVCQGYTLKDSRTAGRKTCLFTFLGRIVLKIPLAEQLTPLIRKLLQTRETSISHRNHNKRVTGLFIAVHTPRTI